MANEHVIEWEGWMLSQVCAERSFPAIRPASPEPSDPSFNRVDVSALIEATRAKSLLNEEEK